MEALIQRELGFPVSISQATSKWSGISLVASIEDVTISDYDEQKQLKPFISIETIKLRPKLLPLILKQELDYDGITLQGLKVLVGWKDEHPLNILGLKGEYLPSSVDLNPLLQILAEKNVMLEQSEIRWLNGKNLLIQHLDGSFSNGDDNKKILQFEGTQGFIFGKLSKDSNDSKESKELKDLSLDKESLDFIPESPVKFSFNKESEQASLSTELFRVKVDCVFDKKSHPNLNCNASGDLEQGLEFLQHTPLKSTVGAILEPLDPEGPMTLNLTAELSDSPKKSFFKGNIHTEHSNITIPDLDIPITNLNGDFQFDAEGVYAQDVQGKIMGRDYVGKISPEKISVTGMITSKEIQKELKIHLLKHFEGQSIFTISRYNDNSHWQIESDLKGMSIDFPAPLGKDKDAPRHMDMSIYSPESGERKITFSMDKLIDAKWISFSKNGSHKFKRGHIALGEKASIPNKDSVLVSGNIAKLDLEEWLNFLKREEGESSTILPLKIRFLVDNLKIFGLSFKKTWLDMQSHPDKVEWQVEGPEMKGGITLAKSLAKNQDSKNNEGNQNNPENKAKSFTDFTGISIELERLKLNPSAIKPENASTNTKTDANTMFSESSIIPVSFHCADLRLDDRAYGDVSFHLHPEKGGYEIKDLSAKSDHYSLDANGHWKIGSKSPHSAKNARKNSLIISESILQNTTLSGQIYSENIGRTFNEWGITSSLQKGKGRISFDLNWKGSPVEFSLAKSNGRAEINFRSGYILGINPGMGRMFSLFSVENIQRRMKLDFGDVYKKGFAFDTLKTNLVLDNGFARTEDLKVDGPIASVALAGFTNLSSKELDFNMNIIPKVSATLPLAAGLAAANPAVGLGVLVLGKVVGSQMGPITQYNYHVSGTWEAPKLESTGSNRRDRG